MKRRQIPWSFALFCPKHLGYFTLVALSLLLSCEKKDAEPDCGCESKEIIGYLSNNKAHHNGNGLFLVSENSSNGPIGLFSACHIDPTWKKSPKDVFDYTLSGRYKRQCLPNGVMPYVANNPIELTTVILPEN